MTPSESADETFRAGIGLVTAGMLLPALPVVLARDSIVGMVTYDVFLSVIAVSFGLAAFAVIELFVIDRATFVFVAVVWPWIVGFGGLLGVLLLNEGEQIPQGPVADAFRTLTGNPSVWGAGASEFELFAYGASYVIGGVGAVILSTVFDRFVGDAVLTTE